MATVSTCDRCGRTVLSVQKIRLQKNGDSNYEGMALREFCSECHGTLWTKLVDLLIETIPTPKVKVKKGKKK